jgi:hypothetical protein
MPKCQDELSVLEVPIATAWRVERRGVRGSLSFPPGTGIAVLNAMPSPRT